MGMVLEGRRVGSLMQRVGGVGGVKCIGEGRVPAPAHLHFFGQQLKFVSHSKMTFNYFEKKDNV